MGIIYCALNKVNGKVYIGQTIGGLENRRRKHMSEAKLYPDMPFARALAKYGAGTFAWFEVDNDVDRDALDEKEIKWIRLLSATDPKRGYNVTVGGRTVKLSPKREEMRVAKLRKKVYQYSMDGEFIKEWNSCKNAMMEMNDTGGVIPRVARGLGYAKTYKNFMWSYKKKKKLKPVDRKWSGPHAAKILQLSFDEEIIKEWESALMAAKSLDEKTTIENIRDNIISVCRGEKESAYGYIWKFYDDYQRRTL